MASTSCIEQGEYGCANEFATDDRHVHVNIQVNRAFSSQPWSRGISILNFDENSGAVSYELITDDEPNVNAASIQSIFEAFLETEQLFVSLEDI